MPTRKIAEPPPRPCQHREHDPANMIVRSPGTYEHACPACGHRQVFTVSAPHLSAARIPTMQWHRSRFGE